jgi:hypothetical protein
MGAGGRPGAGGLSPRAMDGDAAAWRRRLTRLGVEVEGLRTRLASVQTELRALAALEATRPLDADQTRRVTRLRLESEGLRLEGAALREAFRRLRDAGRRNG